MKTDRVFIKQDGTIPDHRIIEELERMGGVNHYLMGGCTNTKYTIDKFGYINFISDGEDISGYTELLYNKETDSFYENTTVLSNSSNIEKDLGQGEYFIPEGYEATIEDGKVIVKKKKWQPKEGDKVWTVISFPFGANFSTHSVEINDIEHKECDVFFQFEDEAQAFCDRLNNAIAPIIEERRKNN